MESQILKNHKIEGRKRDSSAVARIHAKINDELSELQTDSAVPRQSPDYHSMGKEDLSLYKEDLAHRLSLFLTEANDIKNEIRKISGIQKSD